MRGAAALVVGLVVLGGCTEDHRSRPQPRASEPIEGCDVRPGAVPKGFTLRGSRGIPQGNDRVGMREEYRDRAGRLLVYLLGVAGEVGEGLPLGGRPTLMAGGRARFLGQASNWVLTWNEAPPCSQMSIVGNGFERDEFMSLLEEAGVIEG